MTGTAVPAGPDPVLGDLLRRHRVAQERRGNLPHSIEKRETNLRALSRALAPLTLLDATREDIEVLLDGRRGTEGRPITSRSVAVHSEPPELFPGAEESLAL